MVLDVKILRTLRMLDPSSRCAVKPWSGELASL